MVRPPRRLPEPCAPARQLPKGDALLPEVLRAVRPLARALLAAGVRPIAISLLHAHVNPEHERRRVELVRAADEAMYAAKQAGRDRIVVFSNNGSSAG